MDAYSLRGRCHCSGRGRRRIQARQKLIEVVPLVSTLDRADAEIESLPAKWM
jgi:hypothetical protein